MINSVFCLSLCICLNNKPLTKVAQEGGAPRVSDAAAAAGRQEPAQTRGQDGDGLTAGQDKEHSSKGNGCYS